METYYPTDEQKPEMMECSGCGTVFSLLVYSECPGCEADNDESMDYDDEDDGIIDLSDDQLIMSMLMPGRAGMYSDTSPFRY